ncbi:hypothetical protein TSAR_014647, partial [Trichomalopsis sarcophagae]
MYARGSALTYSYARYHERDARRGCAPVIREPVVIARGSSYISRGRREASWCCHRQQARRPCQYGSNPGLYWRVLALLALLIGALPVSIEEPPLAPALTGEVRSSRRTGKQTIQHTRDARRGCAPVIREPVVIARGSSYISRGRREASWCRHRQQARRPCRYGSNPGLYWRVLALLALLIDALPVSIGEQPLAPALT